MFAPLAALAIAADPGPATSWEAFVEARKTSCFGGLGEVAPPVELTVSGRRYRLLGHRLVELERPATALRIGVISATKDEREETLAAIAELLAGLEGRGIDLLVANGDLAEDEFALEAVLEALSAAKVPVLAFAGNSESCGSMNRVLAKVSATKRHVLNGHWVRRVELPGGTVLTLPGYYDRRFGHRPGTAIYGGPELEALSAIAAGAPKPWILTSHGPPRMSGPHGLDLAGDAGHVGDPKMTEWLRAADVRFGIFGHILEAGGRGSDLDGKQRVKEGAAVERLYVNAGTANPDPWGMLDKSTSHGMALWFSIEGGRARHAVLRRPAPRR